MDPGLTWASPCRDVTEAMARDLPVADHRLQELLVVEQAIEDGWPTQ